MTKGKSDVGEGFSPPALGHRGLPRRKPNRLPMEIYRSGGVFFLTACARSASRPFLSPQIVASCLSALKETADKQGTHVIEYCFMPDHVHLLVAAPHGADVAALMQRFKQRAGFASNRLLGSDGPFWQRSYYDHVLRRDDDIESVRRYMRDNPVRAGLVVDADTYPFSGSLVGEREG